MQRNDRRPAIDRRGRRAWLALRSLTSGLIFLIACLLISCGARAQRDASGTLEDWSVPDGFGLSADAVGFRYPTSLVFVPEPGPNPRDPAYFVAEVLGTIKVVTNDRTVQTFATDFSPLSAADSFSAFWGVGLGGLCLDPETGFIFATYAATGADGVLHNHILRFETSPHTFALRPTTVTDISGGLAYFGIAPNHVIGDCRVRDRRLYVGVGDGAMSATSRNLKLPLGKVLRLTLDGKAAPENPFYDSENPDSATSAIFASGFRNPFGIEFGRERLFAADNGNAVDRFLQVQAGGDYLWDGTDWSIGASADAVFAPSLGVTHLAFVPPASSSLSPSLGNSFLVGTSGQYGKLAAIIAIPFDFTTEAVQGAPSNFVLYRPDANQYVVALALGPDGLYFAPLLSVSGGDSPVYKVSLAAQGVLSARPEARPEAYQLLRQKGCLSCHSMQADVATSAPTLQADALVAHIRKRLDSPVYREQAALLDQRTDEPFASYRAERAEVLAASGDERIEKWITYHLQEPRFDNMQATMPNLDLNAAEAASLAGYLIHPRPVSASGLAYHLLQQIAPELRYRHLLVFFAAGLLAGLLAATLIGAVAQVRRRRFQG